MLIHRPINPTRPANKRWTPGDQRNCHLRGLPHDPATQGISTSNLGLSTTLTPILQLSPIVSYGLKEFLHGTRRQRRILIYMQSCYGQLKISLHMRCYLDGARKVSLHVLTVTRIQLPMVKIWFKALLSRTSPIFAPEP